jgi:hypothetical protein
LSIQALKFTWGHININININVSNLDRSIELIQVYLEKWPNFG